MPLNADDKCEVDKLAELKVRRYLDGMFDQTLPRIIGAAIGAHNTHVDAHSGLFKQKWSTLKLVIAAFIAGAGGGGIAKLVSMF